MTKQLIIQILGITVFLAGLFLMTLSYAVRIVKGTAIISVSEPGTYIFQVIRDNGATPADFNMPEKRKGK